MISGTLIILLLSLIFIIKAKTAKTQEEYIVAGRRTKLFPLIATLVMTEINPMALIAMSALGYSVGYWALGMAVNAFIGPLFASFVTAKKWKCFNGACVSQLFDYYLGRNIGNIVRLILLISLIILSATYIKGIMIFSQVVYPNFPVLISILIILVFCIFSVMKNGLSGIIHMDIIGFFLTSILIFLCFLFSIKNLGIEHLFYKASVETVGVELLSKKYLFSLLVLQSIMYSVAPWWGQKIFSANNTGTAYQASIISAFLIFIVYAAVIVLSVFLKKYGVLLKNSSMAFPEILVTFFPSKFKCFYVLAFVYIATTTICGVWCSISGLITLGFLQHPEDGSPKINYIIWIFLGIITYAISVFAIENVLHAAVLAVMQICSIFFSVISIFHFNKASKVSCLMSIFLSIAIGYFSFFYWGEKGEYIWYWAIIGLPVTFIGGYMLLKFESRKKAILQRNNLLSF